VIHSAAGARPMRTTRSRSAPIWEYRMWGPGRRRTRRCTVRSAATSTGTSMPWAPAPGSGSSRWSCFAAREGSVKDRERSHLDAFARRHHRVARVGEGAVRCHPTFRGGRGIEILEEPRLIDPHVRGKVPALPAIVHEVVDLARAVWIAQLDCAQVLWPHRRT